MQRGVRRAEARDYLANLKKVAFVKKLGLSAPGSLIIQTSKGQESYDPVVRQGKIGHQVVGDLIARSTPSRKTFLFAPYIPTLLGERLVDAGIQYMDKAGNCHVAIGKNYYVHIASKKPAAPAPEVRGLHAAGYQVLFALLAKPDLLDAPVRTLAEMAGVGKTSAATVLRRLEKDGVIGATTLGWRFLRRQDAVESWLVGYADVVRPRALFGRYRASEPNYEELEARIEKALPDDLRWAWGGGSAALRMTRYYHGENTELHMEDAADWPRKLRLLPSQEGAVLIFETKSPVAFEGALPHTMHPLLVYASLLSERSDRGRSAAREVVERFLAP